MFDIQVLHVMLKRSIAGMSQKELVFKSRELIRVHSGSWIAQLGSLQIMGRGSGRISSTSTGRARSVI